MAINREVAVRLAEPPEGVDRPLWLYELCRFLTMKVNNLVVAFFAEEPPCSSQTCPEMRASEWQYLCAVHDPPKSCCAIDYCCHTLDWATNILTSPKYFPSRLTLGSAAHGGSQGGMRHLTNIFRRLYRIFAHAWFQHREVFWQVEGHDGLYIFFKTVCDMYNLIPEDNYTIPAEAEGVEAQQPGAEETLDGRRLTILRKEDEGSGPSSLFPDTDAPGATTRRHKHTPSTGSRVTTIAESAEDAEDTQKPSSLPEVNEEFGKKETELPVNETGEPGGQTMDASDAAAQETAEVQEKAQEKPESQPAEAELSEPRPSETQHSEPQLAESESSESQRSVTPPSESQPSESQPSEPESAEPQLPESKPSETENPEPQEPEPQLSEQKEQGPSEEPVSEREPEPSSEKPAAEDPEHPVKRTEKQTEPSEPGQSNAEAESQPESEVAKPAIEDTTNAAESEPESKPTEPTTEAPKET